jgi:hypothetical protein
LELESSIAPKAHRRESLHKLPIHIFKEYPGATKAPGELPSITRFWTPSITGKSRKTRFSWEGAQYSRALEPVNRLSQKTVKFRKRALGSSAKCVAETPSKLKDFLSNGSL